MEATSIVGVFDNPHDVQPVIDDLQKAGVSRSDIEVMDQKACLDCGTAATDDNEQRGAFSGFKRWLSDFGLADSERDYFAETVRRGGTMVTVRTMDGTDQDNIANILASHGAVDIDRRGEYYKSSGFKGFDVNSKPYSQDEVIAERERFQAGGQFAIPVVEEDVKIGKRRLNTGGVRIVKRVIETPVERDIQLRDETVDIERRSVDRPLNAGDMDSLRDDSLEFTESREEATVQKEARVKEEVLVRQNVQERTEHIRETARRTDVDVERTEGDVNSREVLLDRDADTNRLDLDRR